MWYNVRMDENGVAERRRALKPAATRLAGYNVRMDENGVAEKRRALKPAGCKEGVLGEWMILVRQNIRLC